MKNKTRQIVALLVTAAMLTGCGAVQNQDVVSEQTKTQGEKHRLNLWKKYRVKLIQRQ